MNTYAANSMRDIEKFINENGIEQSQIVDIFQSNDSTFLVIYYAE